MLPFPPSLDKKFVIDLFNVMNKHISNFSIKSEDHTNYSHSYFVAIDELWARIYPDQKLESNLARVIGACNYSIALELLKETASA